jgi:hypothetical protein
MVVTKDSITIIEMAANTAVVDRGVDPIEEAEIDTGTTTSAVEVDVVDEDVGDDTGIYTAQCT